MPAAPLLLNLGCGEHQLSDHINVDLYGSPDVKHDLNLAPYPWDDCTVDGIVAFHIFEHLDDWWLAFTECARILKIGGILEMRVPDESSSSALTYRDHHHVFSRYSFHGIEERIHGTNAWAREVQESVPLRLEDYKQVPFPQYQWMVRACPRLLVFCSNHLRNFIWEQRLLFRKTRRG